MLAAKVGIKSCRSARECVSFVHVRMNAYPAAIAYLSKHMQYVEWLVINYLFPYFLLRSLLPFLNSKFKKNLVCLLFIAT